MAPLKVLSALDAAKLQYYHFKAIIVAGMGLFSDAYDFFCISPVMHLLAYVYYHDDNSIIKAPPDPKHSPLLTDQVPPVVTPVLVTIPLLGAVIGQLVFGRLGDLVGRRRVYITALMIMVFSSIACGFSMGRCRTCVLLSLGMFRFSLGVGIGGDYPLSATIMSEFANKRTRGTFIAAVFSMQGFGILVSSTVIMATCAIFNAASGGRNQPAPETVDMAWRVILIMGAIPACLTCYCRMMMPETPRYTALVEKNVVQATKDMKKVVKFPLSPIPEEEDEENYDNQYANPKTVAEPPATVTNQRSYSSSSSSSYSYGLFSKEFLRRDGRDLFSCSAAWFLVDVVFYSNNLFQSRICQHYLNPDGKSLNVYEEAFRVARLQAIVAICSSIPGYFATVYFIDRIGRVRIQMMGFLFMALWLFAMAIMYHSYWNHKNTEFWFMLLYGLFFFSSNFGPNTTTFIVPAELFPARLRSTCHGISGAAGKVGAIIGSVGFFLATRNNGHGVGRRITGAVVVLGVVSLIGSITTCLLTQETMRRSLEDNEEDQELMGAGSGRRNNTREIDCDFHSFPPRFCLPNPNRIADV